VHREKPEIVRRQVKLRVTGRLTMKPESENDASRDLNLGSGSNLSGTAALPVCVRGSDPRVPWSLA
jgi:hypothetical protein